jgi:hypothetical protein
MLPLLPLLRCRSELARPEPVARSLGPTSEQWQQTASRHQSSQHNTSGRQQSPDQVWALLLQDRLRKPVEGPPVK